MHAYQQNTVQLQDRLTGALIGLARATDGNEHLISPSSTAVIAACLPATRPGAEPDAAELEALLKQVEQEKRKMVPGCFVCAAPCGKTSDYDVARLQSAPEEIRRLKGLLLSGIRDLAACPHRDDAADRFFYKALVVIGMEDYEAEDLRPILQEAGEWNRRSRDLPV